DAGALRVLGESDVDADLAVLLPHPAATNASVRTAARPRRTLAAAGSDDRIREEPGEHSDEQPIADDVHALGLRRDAQQLHDDVEDRAGGQREEHHADGFAGESVTDRGTDERRATTDQAEREQKTPTGAALRAVGAHVAGEGRNDPEPFGGVVRREPDD